ncbi:hypothetical protein MBH78_13250 [Oceanimonas sp. NS1]|nr:hypothetical protein [Oceanimonas sp. NS1]
MKLGDILYLAMAAAHQLTQVSNEPAWVELVAVDCQQAAFSMETFDSVAFRV